MKPRKYVISIDGYDGTYEFSRLEIAQRAFDLLQLSPEEPAVLLSRSDAGGTLHVLAERHFEAEETE